MAYVNTYNPIFKRKTGRWGKYDTEDMRIEKIYIYIYVNSYIYIYLHQVPFRTNSQSDI